MQWGKTVTLRTNSKYRELQQLVTGKECKHDEATLTTLFIHTDSGRLMKK